MSCRKKVVELDRMIGTFRRNIEYLEHCREEEVQREAMEMMSQCGIIPVNGILHLGRVAATEEQQTAPPPSKRTLLENQVVEWFDAAGDERRARMLVARKYIDMAEPRISRDNVEYELRRELARIEGKK